MATVTLASADQFSLLKWIQAHQSEAATRPPRGAIVPLQIPISLLTTHLDNADDKVQLVWFPAGIWLFGGSVRFSTAPDSDATPTLVYDVITETAAGVADSRKIISASSQLVADKFDDVAYGAYVGERYLSLDPTTAAATAAATTMILTMLVSRGVATNKLPSITMDEVS